MRPAERALPANKYRSALAFSGTCLAAAAAAAAAAMAPDAGSDMATRPSAAKYRLLYMQQLGALCAGASASDCLARPAQLALPERPPVAQAH